LQINLDILKGEKVTVSEFEGKSSAKKVEIEFPEDQTAENEAEIQDSKTVEAETASEKLQGNDYLEQLQRLQAEFANYKKRVAKEQFYSVE